ncbi:MAG: hypothetical protein U1D35_04755, partial [Paracoccaceae bacterium]|nr:hypothetical protein [Paracoccaceae bacterium]
FLATGAFAGPDGKVKEIDVQIDLAALTNPAAAARYATIADDLKTALLVRLTDRLGEEGMRVAIDLSEVELTNSFQEKLGLADNRLVGDVKISDMNDNTHFKAYELTVTMDQAKTYFPVGLDVTVLTISSDEYYTAMIEAFADSVVGHLNE